MPDQFASPILQAAYDYWQLRRRGRLMPARADIDPADIPRLLPNIILTDVLAQKPLDFRYRLIGTAVCERTARDYTGVRFMDLPHQRPGSMIWDTRAACVRKRAPVYDGDLPYVGPVQRVRVVSQVHLPLSTDGATVNMIFTAVAFEEHV